MEAPSQANAQPPEVSVAKAREDRKRRAIKKAKKQMAALKEKLERQKSNSRVMKHNSTVAEIMELKKKVARLSDDNRGDPRPAENAKGVYKK
jgi:hypothetical protein